MPNNGIFVSSSSSSSSSWKLCNNQYLKIGRFAHINDLEDARKWLDHSPTSIGVIELASSSDTNILELTTFLNSRSPTLVLLPGFSKGFEQILSDSPNCGFACTTDSAAAIERCLTSTIRHGFGVSSSLLTGLISSPKGPLFRSFLPRFTDDDLEILRHLSADLKTVRVARLTNYSCASINRRIRKFNEIFDTSSKSELTFYLRNLMPEGNEHLSTFSLNRIEIQ